MTPRASSGYTTRRSIVSGIQKTVSSPKWEDFWKQYEPYVRRICREKLRNESDVDDVVSKVMVQIFKQIKEYDPAKGRFRAWMKTIASRRAIEEYRRIARELKRRDDPEADPMRTAPIEKILDSRSGPRTLYGRKEDNRLLVSEAVERTKKLVSPQQWQIFDCSWRREWPTERVCETLGVTRNQVALARGRVGEIYKRELQAAAKEMGQTRHAKPQMNRGAKTAKRSTVRTPRQTP